MWDPRLSCQFQSLPIEQLPPSKHQSWKQRNKQQGIKGVHKARYWVHFTSFCSFFCDSWGKRSDRLTANTQHQCINHIPCVAVCVHVAQLGPLYSPLGPLLLQLQGPLLSLQVSSDALQCHWCLVQTQSGAGYLYISIYSKKDDSYIKKIMAPLWSIRYYTHIHVHTTHWQPPLSHFLDLVLQLQHLWPSHSTWLKGLGARNLFTSVSTVIFPLSLASSWTGLKPGS